MCDYQAREFALGCFQGKSIVSPNECLGVEEDGGELCPEPPHHQLLTPVGSLPPFSEVPRLISGWPCLHSEEAQLLGKHFPFSRAMGPPFQDPLLQKAGSRRRSAHAYFSGPFIPALFFPVIQQW